METQLGGDQLLLVLQLERAQIPELLPAQCVLIEQLVEAGQADHLAAGLQAGSDTAGSRDVYTVVTFSTAISSPWATSEEISRPIIGLFLDRRGRRRADLAAATQPGPRGLGDPNVRLAGLDLRAG